MDSRLLHGVEIYSSGGINPNYVQLRLIGDEEDEVSMFRQGESGGLEFGLGEVHGCLYFLMTA